MNGEDDNQGQGTTFSGAHNYISYHECKKLHATLKEDIEDIKLALWGTERRNGLVGDVRDLKRNSQLLSRLGSVLLGIISSAVTAYIITLVG